MIQLSLSNSGQSFEAHHNKVLSLPVAQAVT